MKMIILIVKDSEPDALTRALTSAEYRVTRIASTGGFLRSGVATYCSASMTCKWIRPSSLFAKPLQWTRPPRKRVSLFVVPVNGLNKFNSKITVGADGSRYSKSAIRPTISFQHKIINQSCLPEEHRHRKQSLSGYFFQFLQRIIVRARDYCICAKGSDAIVAFRI